MHPSQYHNMGYGNLSTAHTYPYNGLGHSNAYLNANRPMMAGHPGWQNYPSCQGNLECERRLVNLLVCIQEGEADIETHRQLLCRIEDFSLNAAFQIFDQNQDGVIDSAEIALFLKENKSRCGIEQECNNLVEYFDANGDHKLTFNEFSQILLPYEDNVLRNVTLDRSHKAIEKLDILPSDIANGITDVFEKEIEFAKRLCVLKRELCMCCPNHCDSYKYIDKHNSGCVDTVNLGAFLGAHGKNFNDMDLLAIIRRVDTNGDATISC